MEDFEDTATPEELGTSSAVFTTDGRVRELIAELAGRGVQPKIYVDGGCIDRLVALRRRVDRATPHDLARIEKQLEEAVAQSDAQVAQRERWAIEDERRENKGRLITAEADPAEYAELEASREEARRLAEYQRTDSYRLDLLAEKLDAIVELLQKGK